MSDGLTNRQLNTLRNRIIRAEREIELAGLELRLELEKRYGYMALDSGPYTVSQIGNTGFLDGEINAHELDRLMKSNFSV